MPPRWGIAPVPGYPEGQTLPAFPPTNAPRDTRPAPRPHGCRPLASAHPRRFRPPRCAPAPPPAPRSPPRHPSPRLPAPRIPAPRHPAPRHPAPRHPAPRPWPAVSPPRPGQTRGLPAGTQRSGASHRPADGRTDRRAVLGAALPAGCPAEPLPGGVCRRRACWRCGAAEPWQERGTRR